jgi:hypothetical protein
VLSVALTHAQSLLHGWRGLAVAYTAVQVPLAASLITRRATFGRLLVSPLLAMPITAAVGLGMAGAAPLWHGLGIAAADALSTSAGVALSAALGYLTGQALSRSGGDAVAHRRGALVSQAPALPVTRRGSVQSVEGASGEITLAGVRVPEPDEAKHFKIVGTTGTGKSTAITELLDGALNRGDGAIIADPDGSYMRRFYDAGRGDVVLNPFEPTSSRWDLFGEITDAYDVDQLARSLIPDHEGADRSWRGYARTFFTAVASQVDAVGDRDVRELYRLLVVAGTGELKTLVAGTPAQPFLEEHNGRMFDSIRSVTSSAVSALDYVSRQRSKPLSVRTWVRESRLARSRGVRRGVLFMPYKAGQIAALRSTISAWMRLAIFEAMNGGEGDQRLWFVVDELDALGQIDGLKDALARLRKFGGRCVLGFQSVAQVSSTYGGGEAQTLVENCGNTLILRCSGSEHGGTSRFASSLIGEREVLRTTVSRSRMSGHISSTTTLAEHLALESAVMGSEIEQLPDLTGYLKLASRSDWLCVVLRHRAQRHTAPHANSHAHPATIGQAGLSGSPQSYPFIYATTEAVRVPQAEEGNHLGS